MNYIKQLNEAKSYMRTFHKDDTTGHDVAHVERVLNLAKFIADTEQSGELLIIELASILHDTVDSKLTDTAYSMTQLSHFLQKIQISDENRLRILYIIEHMSYKGGANNNVPLSIEGQIVRDADRLDAMGAIGIARTFQFAGHFDEPMWISPTSASDLEYETHYPPHTEEIMLSPQSAIKHFYDKLFKLKSLIHTETGKQIAEERHHFMEQFITQFFQEWYFNNQ